MVTNDINEKLIMNITIEEVEMALKQMAPLKSPSPNSMPPLVLPKLLVFDRIRCFLSHFILSKHKYSATIPLSYFYNLNPQSKESGICDTI